MSENTAPGGENVNPDVPDVEDAAAAQSPAAGENNAETPDVEDTEIVVDDDQEHPDTKLAAERLEDLQRLNAEYVNYRNRVAREKESDKNAAIGSVVESLIPVLDDIELARQHGDLDGGPMEKIADKIETVLARYGVEAFGEVNEPFDPNFHEALMHVEAEQPEGVDGTFIAQVLQKGFKVNDRLVRAARVSVAG